MDWLVSAFSDEAGGSCDIQIGALQRAVLKNIDIRNIEGHGITVLPFDTAREVKSKLDAAGIAVNMFGSPIGKIDISEDVQSDIDRLRHLGELAPILDCRAVRMFSYYNKDGAPHQEWKKESVDRMVKLRTEAAELGLVLFHENERHIFGDSVVQVLDSPACATTILSSSLTLITTIKTAKMCGTTGCN